MNDGDKIIELLTEIRDELRASKQSTYVFHQACGDSYRDAQELRLSTKAANR